MKDYSIGGRKLQALSSGDYCNEETGEFLEVLRDDRFAWRERKKKANDLTDIYTAAQLDDKAENVKSCSTWLEYLAMNDGRRQLLHYNACKQRLCPICAARKAKIMARRLFRIMSKASVDHAGTQYIFLTLTMRNVPGDKLRDALDLLTKAWYRLCHRRPVDRAIKGWFRALEITRNRLQNTYHPHIHAILMVEDGYFERANGLYLTHDRWVEMWQQSLRVDYKPTVHIERTRNKAGNVSSKAAAAAIEAAKYATKDVDYLSKSLSKAEAAEVAKVYTDALVRKRMTALGGWMKDTAKALALDEIEDVKDLVRDDDSEGELTPETAELLEVFSWHFGVSDYIISSRRVNPNYITLDGDEDE